jgi:glycerol-3-phosphate dehydrogenase
LVKIVFPTITVDRSHIVFRFAGVRPLPHNDSASTTGQISRDHSIRVIEPGVLHYPVYALVGGKWTTFRAFSEQVTERVLAYLGKSRSVYTQDLAIGGGAKYPQGHAETQTWLKNLAQSSAYPADWLARLFARYGTRLEMMLPFLTQGTDAPLESCPDYTQREIRYLAAHEKVVHLDDLILRRTLIGMRGAASMEVLQEIAALAGEELKWSQEMIQQEIERTVQLLREHNGVERQQRSAQLS